MFAADGLPSIPHRIHHKVNPKPQSGICERSRREGIIRPLPIIAEIIIVGSDSHDPALIVQDSPKSGLALASGAVGRNDIEGLDVVEAVEDGVADRELLEGAIRQNPLHVCHQLAPLSLTSKVVEDHESALLQVLSQVFDLLVGCLPVPGLRYVQQRVLHNLRVVEIQD